MKTVGKYIHLLYNVQVHTNRQSRKNCIKLAPLDSVMSVSYNVGGSSFSGWSAIETEKERARERGREGKREKDKASERGIVSERERKEGREKMTERATESKRERKRLRER